jgi:hypothetical protein
MTGGGWGRYRPIAAVRVLVAATVQLPASRRSRLLRKSQWRKAGCAVLTPPP